MLVVEIGMQLNKSYIFYEKILKEHGLECVFECITHDIYFINNDFSNIDNMTEKQLKDSCIRIRQVNDGDYEIQNNLINNYKRKKIKYSKFSKLEKELNKYGYRKAFDTIKYDHHWYKNGMTTRVQLQETKDLGLLVYLDNKAYYEYELEELWKKLGEQNIRARGVNSFLEVLKDGYNQGYCTVAAKQVSYSLNWCYICGGVLPILEGTANCPDGSHTWIEQDDWIIDTTLMLFINKGLKDYIGYNETNRYIPTTDPIYNANKEFTNDTSLSKARQTPVH